MKTLPVNSRRRLLAISLAAAIVAAGALSPGSAQAHHSFAGFDQTRKVTVQGVVKDWQFTNPHSWLQLIVTENGEQVEYSIEGASVSTLVRRGWTRNTFQKGQKLTVVMHPLSSGGKGGAFLSATFEDGRTISSGITPN
jgi:Family of unknown function (DUF6152)